MLEVKDLYVSYGRIAALNGLSLSVKEDSIVSLIGPNGAGKSTFLNAISGLVRIKSGVVRFKGEALPRLPHVVVSKGLVHVPEGRKIFSGLTVKENLLAGAYLNGNWSQIEKDLEEVYAMFPVLKERQNQLAKTLSGGEQQMLALGRALMAKPKLILMDEPSMGLSPLLVQEIAKIIRQFKDMGFSVLLIEQNAVLALHLADHGYVLETGSIALEGDARELLTNEHVKKAYLGG